MQMMLVCMHAQVHKIVFLDDAQGQSEFDRFQERLKEDRFSRNREDDRTIVITSPDGFHDFVLEKVEGVRLIDYDKEQALVQPFIDRDEDKEINRKIKYYSALKEAGLYDK